MTRPVANAAESHRAEYFLQCFNKIDIALSGTVRQQDRRSKGLHD